MPCLSVLKIAKPLFFKSKVDFLPYADAPCGDMTWMPHFLRSRSDVDYTGKLQHPQHYLLSNFTLKCAVQELWDLKKKSF